MAVIVNPRSGSAPAVADLERALGAAGLNATVFTVPEGADVAAWLTELGQSHQVLTAAGGDGTVSAVAAAAAMSGKTLGVIPAGTLNHFARDAGIPLELEQAVAVLAAGHTRLLDAGVVNDRVFVNNASIGAYPQLVWERTRARHKGIPRPIATGIAGIRTWLDLRSVTVRLCVDGKERIRRSPFVFIGNSEYEVEGTQFGRRPLMTDGSLWLYLTPDNGRLGVLTLPVRALLRKLREHDKFETWAASEISIDLPNRRIAVALDGEVMRLASPLRFSVKRGVLRTIVPADDADHADAGAPV
jgi:diacylglycerol kinase family enzyme